MLSTYRVSNETIMTYSEFKRVYAAQKQERRKEVLYYIKQKACGLALLAIGILAPACCDGDGTLSIMFFLPLGLYLLFTRKKIMDFNGK